MVASYPNGCSVFAQLYKIVTTWTDEENAMRRYRILKQNCSEAKMNETEYETHAIVIRIRPLEMFQLNW